MKVFISHSFDDQMLANDLQHILYEKEISAYMAEQKPEYDLSIGNKIRREIGESDHMVVFITESGYLSPSVNQEIGYAQGIGIKPIIMIQKGVSKLGVLTSEYEREEFEINDPLSSYIRIREYILSKGLRNKNTNEDHIYLLENVYRPLYNKIIILQKNEFFTTNKLENPWNKIDNFSKFKTVKTLQKIFERLDDEIDKWNRMTRQLEREFFYKQKELGNIFLNCFSLHDLLTSNNEVRVGDDGCQELRYFVSEFKEVLLFDDVISGQQLYEKMHAHSILRNDDYHKYLQIWRTKTGSKLFDCLYDKLPELRKYYESDLIDPDLLQQKKSIQDISKQIQFVLESKLVNTSQ